MPDTLIAIYIILGAMGALILILFKPLSVSLYEAIAAGFKIIILMLVALVFVWVVTAFTAFK